MVVVDYPCYAVLCFLLVWQLVAPSFSTKYSSIDSTRSIILFRWWRYFIWVVFCVFSQAILSLTWHILCTILTIQFVYYRSNITWWLFMVIKLYIEMGHSLSTFHSFPKQHPSSFFMVKVFEAKETCKRIVDNTWWYSTHLHGWLDKKTRVPHLTSFGSSIWILKAKK